MLMKKQVKNAKVYHPKWSDDGQECNFIPPKMKKIIIGTMPPKKLCVNKKGIKIYSNTHKKNNVDFFYGSTKNKLWKKLSEISGNDNIVDNTKNLVDIRKNFSKKYHIGFADVIQSCIHNNNSSYDLNLLSIEPNKTLIKILKEYPDVKIFCTSKNTLNLLKIYFVKEIKEKEKDIYEVKFRGINHYFEIYTMIAASGRAKKDDKYNNKLKKLLLNKGE